MKKIYFLLLIIYTAFQPLFSQTYIWVRHDTHPISFNPDYTLFPSTADPAGNFIIGSIHNFKLIYGSAYYGDVIFRKYSSTGAQLFSKVMTGKAVIKGIDTDGGNNIYMYGSFMDTLKIDSVNLILNTGSGFNPNEFLIKFNPNGAALWKKNLSSIYGNSAGIGCIKIRGSFLYSGLDNINNQGSVKKFDFNGTELMSITQSPVVNISAIDIDAQGNIFSAGSCSIGNIQFGNLHVNSPNQYNLYFAKYNSAGSGFWVRFVQDVTFQNPTLVCDPDGNAYSAGDLSGSFLFGSILTQGPQWVYDFYVTKIDPSGTFLWVKEVPNNQDNPIGDAAIGKLTNVKLDNANNVYITGFQRGTINWGSITTVSSGVKDVLVLKFSTGGNLLWGKTSGGSDARGDAISLDNQGSILLSGNFAQTAVFDTIIVNGTGQINSFAAKLSNPAVTGMKHNNNSTPMSFSLQQNYPNPFNPVTKIRFSIPASLNPSEGGTSVTVTLKIYNVLGEIAILISEVLRPGSYEIQFDGSSFPSGVYFYNLTAGDFTDTKKMMLVK